jgi:Uma2 family endonuclease
MSVPAALKLTYEDYCLLPDDHRYEVIDGELYVTPAPTTFHQAVKGRLKHLLDDLVEAAGLGIVLDAPTDVLLSKHDILQPDILVVLSENQRVLTEKYIDGAPDLVVEVLSPSTRRRDRVLKAKRYAEFGVRELWLVDPDARTIEVLTGGPKGFERRGTYAEADTFRSVLLASVEFAVKPIFRPIAPGRADG